MLFLNFCLLQPTAKNEVWAITLFSGSCETCQSQSESQMLFPLLELGKQSTKLRRAKPKPHQYALPEISKWQSWDVFKLTWLVFIYVQYNLLTIEIYWGILQRTYIKIYWSQKYTVFKSINVEKCRYICKQNMFLFHNIYIYISISCRNAHQSLMLQLLPASCITQRHRWTLPPFPGPRTPSTWPSPIFFTVLLTEKLASLVRSADKKLLADGSPSLRYKFIHVFWSFKNLPRSQCGKVALPKEAWACRLGPYAWNSASDTAWHTRHDCWHRRLLVVSAFA